MDVMSVAKYIHAEIIAGHHQELEVFLSAYTENRELTLDDISMPFSFSLAISCMIHSFNNIVKLSNVLDKFGLLELTTSSCPYIEVLYEAPSYFTRVRKVKGFRELGISLNPMNYDILPTGGKTIMNFINDLMEYIDFAQYGPWNFYTRKINREVYWSIKYVSNLVEDKI